ncbi:RAD51C protein [Phlyctochytrium arcticum]|nr:RAD51C protein [Phlyctochytrium arcticum]
MLTAPQRPLATLDIDSTLKAKLHNAGYRATADLKDVTVEALAQELAITHVEARNLIAKLKPVPFTSTSALEALTRERTRHAISTSSQALDELLGGEGVPAGRVTEICGLPGLGKTQIGMQLCVNVQATAAKNGGEAEAIYIDTEGSFIPHRVSDMIRASLSDLDEEVSDENVDLYLSRIHFFRVHGHLEQVALICQLGDFLQSRPNVKLLVLDSVAFHFRQSFTDMGMRTRLLNSMAQHLRKYADTHDLVVVMMNQMTTRISKVDKGSGGDGETVGYPVPALGDSWGHACTNRIILLWQNDIRHAELVKSPNLQQRTVQYSVTGDGIRDVPNVSNTPKKRAQNDVLDANKRFRDGDAQE